MKNVIFSAVLCFMGLLVPAAWATPAFEMRFIAGIMMDTERHPDVRETLLRPYVDSLVQQLEARSIKVVDPDHLMDVLPDQILEAVKQQRLNAFLERNGGRYQRILLDVSARLRLGLALEAIAQTQPDNHGESGAISAETLKSSDALFDMTEGAMHQFQRRYLKDFEEVLLNSGEIEADLMSPHLIGVIETDGVFDFPNRIWRQNLIRQIEAANK